VAFPVTSATWSSNPLRKALEAYSKRMEVFETQRDCGLGALNAKAVPREDFGSAPSSTQLRKVKFT